MMAPRGMHELYPHNCAMMWRRGPGGMAMLRTFSAAMAWCDFSYESTEL